MKKLFTANKYRSVALALAAFAVAGTAPAIAQSSGTWSAGISARNGLPSQADHADRQSTQRNRASSALINYHEIIMRAVK